MSTQYALNSIWTGDDEQDRRKFEELFLTEEVYGKLRKVIRLAQYQIPGCDPYDLLQDTLTRAYRSRRTYQPEKAPPFTWLSIILINQYKDLYRRYKNRAALSPDNLPRVHELHDRHSGFTQDFSDTHLDILTLREAFASLGERQQRFLRMQLALGMKGKEIASAEEICHQTVKVIIFRAKRQLREQMLHRQKGPA